MQIETIETAAAVESRAAFTIEPAAIEAAAAFLAKRVIERRNTFPILSHIRIAADPAGRLTLTGTDQDNWATVTLAATVETPGAVCVDAAAFADALAKLRKGKASAIHFSDLDGNRAKLSASGTAGTFNLKALPADDFPLAPIGGMEAAAPLSRFMVPASRFLSDLDALAPCQSTAESRYYLNGVAIQVRDLGGRDRLAMVATDGCNMGVASRPLPAGAETLPDVLLHRKAVAILSKAAKLAPEAESLGIEFDPAGSSGGFFRLTLGPVTIASRAIDGTFPDWTRAFATSLAPIEETEAPLFPELIPGTPIAAMSKLEKAAGQAVEWQEGAQGKLGIVPGDDGLLFGVMNMRPDCAEPIKGYHYSFQENDAAALEYLRGQAVKRHGPIHPDWSIRLASDATGYHGATIGATEYKPGYYEERENWETLTVERVYIEPRNEWVEGSYSVVMPRQRAERRADVALEIDGDSTVYPVAVNSGGKIHLSADQVRRIAGDSVFETLALTIAGRVVYVLAWLFAQGDSRFLTVRADGRCFSGKDASKAQYLSREQVEAALRGEDIAEPVEIPAAAGAEGENEPCTVAECPEVVEALSGPEIAPVEPVTIAEQLPEPEAADPIAELAARVAALEARLAPPVSPETGPETGPEAGKGEKIEVAPIGGKAKRSPAHERAIRRAWAERKARRSIAAKLERESSGREADGNFYQDQIRSLKATLEAQKEATFAVCRERDDYMNKGLETARLRSRDKRKRLATIQRARRMLAAKRDAYTASEVQAMVAVERERNADLQRQLEAEREGQAAAVERVGVAAAQAAAQMERAILAEQALEPLRAQLTREQNALAAVTERNAKLAQAMADLAERVERAEAALAA